MDKAENSAARPDAQQGPPTEGSEWRAAGTGTADGPGSSGGGRYRWLHRTLGRLVVLRNRRDVFWFAWKLTAFVLVICDLLNYLMVPSEIFFASFIPYNVIGFVMAWSVTYLFGMQILRVMELTERLKYMVNHDHLTGLATRKFFFEALEAHEGRDGVVIAADVDHFKKINDTLGHKAGDEVLTEMSRRMSIDTRAEDTVARFGGEEFVLFLPGATLADGAIAAERLRRRIAGAKFVTTRGAVGVTASFGVACCRGGAEADLELQRADAALYAAKTCGRNRVVRADLMPGRARGGEGDCASSGCDGKRDVA